MKYFLIALSFMVSACAVTPLPDAPPDLISLQYTPAAAPWLDELYACGLKSDLTFQAASISAADPQSADVTIRLGEPPIVTGAAYQIGETEIVIVLNRENSVTQFSDKQVADLFTGRIKHWSELGGANQPVSVWSYVEGDDIRQWFDEVRLSGQVIASTAKLAPNPDTLAAQVSADAGAIGFLPRPFLSNDLRVVELRTRIVIPVLLLVENETQNRLRNVIACLQE